MRDWILVMSSLMNDLNTLLFTKIIHPTGLVSLSLLYEFEKQAIFGLYFPYFLRRQNKHFMKELSDKRFFTRIESLTSKEQSCKAFYYSPAICRSECHFSLHTVFVMLKCLWIIYNPLCDMSQLN